jgi:uncharacterized protein YutE (UPF0331/DUF86 family)
LVDLARLRSLLSRLTSACQELQPYAGMSLDQYLADRRSVHASKYLLVTAIEDALAIANHIIASEGYRAPADYADAFRSLAEAGVLDQSLSRRLEAMARFRNLLIHVYAEVDDRRVHGFLQSDLSDLQLLARVILDRFREIGGSSI